MKERPPGGHRFEATLMMPEGWVVLSPWITNLDGYWYREILRAPGYGDEAQRWAEHIARQLNGEDSDSP